MPEKQDNTNRTLQAIGCAFHRKVPTLASLGLRSLGTELLISSVLLIIVGLTFTTGCALGKGADFGKFVTMGRSDRVRGESALLETGVGLIVKTTSIPERMTGSGEEGAIIKRRLIRCRSTFSFFIGIT